MQASEIMRDYYVRVKISMEKKKILGEEILNAVIVKKLLRNHLPKYNHVAIIIEYSKYLSMVTYD